MKTLNEILESLKHEARNNAASNAALHAFALRKRARNTINITSLAIAMKKEGFNYPKADYIPLVKKLADLGVGTLVIDQKQRIRGIKDIRVTLQSLGKAVYSGINDIRQFKPRNKFLRLPPPAKTETVKAETAPKVSTNKCSITLGVQINGKDLIIPVQGDLTGEDIAVLINKLQRAS